MGGRILRLVQRRLIAQHDELGIGDEPTSEFSYELPFKILLALEDEVLNMDVGRQKPWKHPLEGILLRELFEQGA